MKIGLTYDLRDDYLRLGFHEHEVAEFDRVDTIEALEDALRSLGHRPERIGCVGALLERLAAGERWDLVFNIAEGKSSTGIGREAQVPTLLDLHGIPYTFSDPLVCALTLHKAVTKRVVRDLGLPTPDFVVVESEADIARVDLPPPLFAKPVAEGSSMGVSVASKIRSRDELARTCRSLLAQFRQPVLVETFLPGREFTVGLVGTDEAAQAVAAMEIHLLPGAEAEVYSFQNKEHYEDRVAYTLASSPIADEACALALTAWRGLGCRDGGRVDVRGDAAGRLNFIEVNVLPGLNPQRSDLPILCSLRGIPYRNLIGRIVESACQRIPGAGNLREGTPRQPKARAGDSPNGATAKVNGPTTAKRGKARRVRPV